MYSYLLIYPKLLTLVFLAWDCFAQSKTICQISCYDVTIVSINRKHSYIDVEGNNTWQKKITKFIFLGKLYRFIKFEKSYFSL